MKWASANGRPGPEIETSRPAEEAEVPPASSGRRRVISLRVAVPLGAALMLAVVVLTSAAVQEREARSSLVHEIQSRLAGEAQHLAQAAAVILMDPFPELRLQPLVRALLEKRSDLANITIVDEHGQIVGCSVAKNLGQSYTYQKDLSAVRTPPDDVKNVWVLENDEVLVTVATIAGATDTKFGFAIVEMRQASIDARLARARERLRLTLLLVLPLAIVVTFSFMSYLLRRVTDLRAGLERIGAGDLMTPLRIHDRTELGLLADTVNDMARRLHSAQRDALERERLRSEVQVAVRIQQSLVPVIRLSNKRTMVAGFQRPASEVGGDYYDVFELPDGRVGLVVADVAGKGVGGCLVTAMLYSLMRAYRMKVTSPSSLLELLDADLQAMLQRYHFVTMWYGILDPTSGRLVHASAGHLPLLVYRSRTKSVEWHRSRSMPLGIPGVRLPRKRITDEMLDLEPGDMIVQYTDGFTEAMEAARGEQFGFERFEEAVQTAAGGDPDSVLKALSETVGAWTGFAPLSDDQTAIVVCQTPTCAREPLVEPGPPISTREDWPDLLRLARTEGSHLSLGADGQGLAELPSWLGAQPGLSGLTPERLQTIETALHEVCRNVGEHGYGSKPEGVFDLWWVPTVDPGPPSGDGQTVSPDSRAAIGYLLVRDDGISFSPGDCDTPNIRDPRVRRRGRGFGLAMIRSLMPGTVFITGTTEGNITVLRVGTADEGKPGEVSSNESLAHD